MFKVRTKNDSKGDLLVEGNREMGLELLCQHGTWKVLDDKAEIRGHVRADLSLKLFGSWL